MALLRRRQQHGMSALVFSRLEWSLWHPVHFGSVQEPEESVESIIAYHTARRIVINNGCRVRLSTIGACRVSGRWPDIRLYDLAEPTRPGQGWLARPRSVAPRGPIHGFHCRGIESIWRGPHDQRDADSGAHRSLRHDQ